MTGPLEVAGAADAPRCEDGLCAVPDVDVTVPDDFSAEADDD